MLTPTFKLEYNQKADCEQRLEGSEKSETATPFSASNQVDITKDVSDYVANIDYTDFESGQSDEISITFEDTEKLWQSAWIPSKGDSLRLYIGYLGEKLLNCGVFEIDEIEFETPPDTLTVKALATSIKKALRQNNSVAYENKSLKQIANEIAKKHGLTLVGDIEEVKVERITQNKERDLTFLKNLAEQYGYIFKIAESGLPAEGESGSATYPFNAGNQGSLVFYKTEKLISAKSAKILYKSDLSRINLSEKTSKNYKAVTVSYHNPKTGTTIKANVKHEPIIDGCSQPNFQGQMSVENGVCAKNTTATAKNPACVKGDTLKISTRCENKQQALLKAKAAMEQCKRRENSYA